MGKRPEQTLQQTHINGKYMQEKMLNITSHLENVNETHHKTTTNDNTSTGKDVKKLDHSNIVDRNATLETSLTVSYKVNQTLTYDLAIPQPHS